MVRAGHKGLSRLQKQALLIALKNGGQVRPREVIALHYGEASQSARACTSRTLALLEKRKLLERPRPGLAVLTDYGEWVAERIDPDTLTLDLQGVSR